MRNTKYLLFIFLLTGTTMLPAQKMERRSVRQGNKLYLKQKYSDAEVSYRKALEVNPKSKEGLYNLGNALYKQEKGKEAIEQYQLSMISENDFLKKAAILHNTGNCCMQTKDYGKAVEAYKGSLRLNPSDDQTRYNLAMAQALLKNQQNQNKNKQNKDKDNNKDKNDQQKQQQKQQQDDQEKKQNQQKQQQQQQEQISKEKAQQLLDALSQDEKDTQEKVNKLQMQQSKAKKTEKDW